MMEGCRWRGSHTQFTAARAMAGKQVGNIVGHAGGNSTCSTAVCDGHAKERRGDGMGFDVIFVGRARDEAVKMDTVSAFDAVVANDQGKKIWGQCCV
jgi:hypothetical protein